MDDNRFEVFDVDDDVHTGLHCKLFKIRRVDCHGCDERVLQDLFAIGDFFGVALEDTAAVFASKDVEHFGFGAKVFNVLLYCTSVHRPPVFRYRPIKQRVHDVHGFVGELVRLDDTLVAHHLENEATLRLILSFLHAHFTAVYRAISSHWIVQTPFEDGQKRFGVHAAREATLRSTMAWDTLIAGEELPAVQCDSGIRRFGRVECGECKLGQGV